MKAEEAELLRVARANLTLARDARAKAGVAATPAQAGAVKLAEEDVEKHQQRLDALGRSIAGAPVSPPKAPALDPKKQNELEFRRGGRLRYGVSLSLLQFRTARPDNEPGRLRNYTPKLDVLPPEIGVQFTHEPAGAGWRLEKNDGSQFQLMSWGGILLFRVSDEALAQGAISMAVTLNFFNNFVGLGLGFDLYRGIPIAGSDGAAGKGTAHTGVLSWAFARQGEVTPENVFVVFTVGVDPIVRALTGELK